MRPLIALMALCIASWSRAEQASEPKVFRELSWGDSVERLGPPLRELKPDSSRKVARAAEDLVCWGQKATNISYSLVQDRLRRVLIEFPSLDPEAYRQLLACLKETYGPGKSSESGNWEITSGRTDVLLNKLANSLTVSLWDNVFYYERYQQIERLFPSIQRAINLAAAKPDQNLALQELRDWLQREMGELLQSVSADSTNCIMLNFAGVGGFLFDPRPERGEAAGYPLWSATPCTIAEALELVRTVPEKLKGHDVLLSAAVVNGCLGFGLSDYWVLADPSQAEAYHNLVQTSWLNEHGKRNGTAAEQAQFDAIVTLKTSPTLDITPDVLKTFNASGILRGHFFDPVYKDRFIITGAGPVAPTAVSCPPPNEAPKIIP